MYLTHITIPMPQGGEDLAREFYSRILGLRELARPEPARARDGVWFEVGGMELHLSVADERVRDGARLHFSLGCGDVDGLKAKMQAAGIAIEPGPAAPRQSFFVHDPFGNRIEVHAPRGLRAGA